MFDKKIIFSIAIVVLLIAGVMIYLYQQKGAEPVKIGYLAIMSGEQSDYMLGMRDGVLLAIEEWNQKGGVKGQHVEIVMRDLNEYEDGFGRAVDELKDEGVVGIIGPALSTMAVKLVPLINEREMLLLSPTVTTSKLAGIDDYFLRACPPDSDAGPFYAKYMKETLGWNRVVGIFHLSNQAFSEGYFMDVKKDFEAMGGIMESGPEFSYEKDYGETAEEIIALAPDGLLLVGNSMDSAKICQELEKRGSEIPVAMTEWSYSPTLVEHGGASVENAYIAVTYFDDNMNEGLSAFKERFTAYFKEDITQQGIFGYDAANMLMGALQESPDFKADTIKQKILDTKDFMSPLGGFSIDEFGDSERELLMITVKDGKFVKTE